VYNLSGSGTISLCTVCGGLSVKEGGVLNNYGGTIESWSLGIENGGVINQYDGSIQTVGLGENISGVFNHYGGDVLIEQAIAPWIRNDISAQGIYNLSGGTLTVQNYFNNVGIFNYSGGELFIPDSPHGWPAPMGGTFINQGAANLSGSGTRVVDGNVVNDGTFKTTNTTAEYTGTFTNNGAYISDPSTQYFDDLVVGETGYFVGQFKDEFFIRGDFINDSKMKANWNTMHSYLGFIDGEDNLHDMYITSTDYGATMAGYANNFSWGTLDVTDQVLTFYDGNDEEGAGLYLPKLWGAEITEDLILANLIGFDGLNIYYMPHLPGNEYLGGLTYALAGGGYLTAAVPDAPTIILLGTALLGLVGLRRKFRD
jgi:hypothetical protein